MTALDAWGRPIVALAGDFPATPRLAPRPADEPARLEALRSYLVLDTVREPAFDELVALAAEAAGCPIAIVSLVDADRTWFKAARGLNLEDGDRERSFSAWAILQPGEPFRVSDATRDPRFHDISVVVGKPGVRAYLGIPLVDRDGHALGTLCVLDTVPRDFDEATVAALRRLARAVMALLEFARAMKRKAALALMDPLTGLPNRRAVMSMLEERLWRGEEVAVIGVDLHNLKETNEAHGHAAGDALLQATARRLQAGAASGGGIVGRMDGDAFTVLVPGATAAPEAVAVAETLGRELRRHPVQHGSRLLPLDASMGVSLSSRDSRDPALLLRLADEALLRTKRERRGSVALATAADAARLAREAVVLAALQAAPDGHLPGLFPVFQPLLDLRRGVVLGLEALARWRHPEIGPVPPEEMFAAAGRLDMADVLSCEVRRQAFGAFAALRREGVAPPRLGTNLSAAELMREGVVEELEAQAEAAGLDMSSLTIEITEDAVLERVAHATLDRLAALRGRGARIALDDFGTGTSGLVQLLRMPLDVIKLDKAFIRGLGTDGRAEKVVEGTLRLARAMNLTVIAEGVETEAQAAILDALGCERVQGWHYARPMDEAELRRWLQAPGRVDRTA